jgi:hypothetical protein
MQQHIRHFWTHIVVRGGPSLANVVIKEKHLQFQVV